MTTPTQMPFDEYLALDRWSASRAKAWRHSERRGAMHEAEQDEPPSAAMRLGTALHACLENPEEFTEKARVVEGLRPNALPKTFAKHEAENPDVHILAEGWAERIIGMIKAMKAHDDAAAFIRARSHCESVVLWDDPDLGVPCKARLDRLMPGVGCWDWKSCSDFTPDGLARSIDKFGYHIQAAMYIRAMNVGLGIDYPKFAYVFVETDEPYEVAVIDLPDDDIEQGLAELEIACNRWKRWRETGEADYMWGRRVQTVGLPRWAQIEGMRATFPLLKG
jgi:hypothetical protein